MAPPKAGSLLERCEKTSWKGEGEAPGKNRCIYHANRPHTVHRDEHGNNFNDAGEILTACGEPYRPRQ